jgi:hypothetical protein
MACNNNTRTDLKNRTEHKKLQPAPQHKSSATSAQYLGICENFRSNLAVNSSHRKDVMGQMAPARKG